MRNVISVLVATSGRHEMFKKMLESLFTTAGGYIMEIIAVVDADPEAAQIAIDFDLNVLDYSPIRRGALWSWNRALFHSDGDIIIPAGDDQIFHPDWLKFALESHRDKLGGYGVVGMNDLAYDGNAQLATMYLMDRKFIKDHLGGVLCSPCYHYYCVDSEINAKAKSLNKFYWDERAKVEHLHSAHGKRPVDELDTGKQQWMEEDNRIFEDRKTRGFPVEWEPVI